MKIVYTYFLNGKMEIKDFLVKLKGEIKRDKWIVKSITNNLYKVPEHIQFSGETIFATTLEFDYIKTYKIFEVDLLNENEDKSVRFHIRNLEKEPKEVRGRIFKYVVKILANLFNSQPISVSPKEYEILEKIHKKKFKKVTIVLINDEYLLPKKYKKAET